MSQGSREKRYHVTRGDEIAIIVIDYDGRRRNCMIQTLLINHLLHQFFGTCKDCKNKNPPANAITLGRPAGRSVALLLPWCYGTMVLWYHGVNNGRVGGLVCHTLSRKRLPDVQLGGGNKCTKAFQECLTSDNNRGVSCRINQIKCVD